MEGWVEKASEPGGPWRQRFLVLHEDSSELCTHPHAYQLSASLPVPSERIALTEQTLVTAAPEAGRCDQPKRHREFVFVVHSSGADHRFACASAGARDSWVELISKAVLARSRAQHAEGVGAGEAQAPVEYIALVAGGLASLAADDIATRLGLPRAEVEANPNPNPSPNPNLNPSPSPSPSPTRWRRCSSHRHPSSGRRARSVR